MTTNRKGRTDCNQATPNTSKINPYFNGFSTQTKGFIVTLALWGWLPVRLAEWLVPHGEQDDE